MKPFLILAALAILVACTPAETPKQPTAQTQITMNRFSGTPTPVTPARSNADIAREFLDFHFTLESGRSIPTFSRFEGPISIAFAAQPDPVAASELSALVSRLRNEAGVPISTVSAGQSANIVISRISRAQLNSIVRGAACFVVPNAQDFASLRGSGREQIDWTRITRRTRAGVFIPEGISAQALRDCLHEEIAQALGPLNDLYRVPDTVFNDDNMHRVLTSYDMMILRTAYASELRSGMSRGAVAGRLPAILARTNPRASGFGTRNIPISEPDWKIAIGKGLFSASANRSAINRAISIAQNRRYGAPRQALGFFARGHANAKSNREAAINDFSQAFQLYSSSLGSRSIQATRASLQLASVAISAGRLSEARQIVDRGIDVSRGAQDAELLYNFIGLKAMIAAASGDSRDPQRLIAEAQSWAAYAIGTGRLFNEYFAILQNRIRQLEGQS
ncbi:MAG: DUF2927 domain-containing protein [Pseudomonadota bacterium]